MTPVAFIDLNLDLLKGGSASAVLCLQTDTKTGQPGFVQEGGVGRGCLLDWQLSTVVDHEGTDQVEHAGSAKEH